MASKEMDVAVQRLAQLREDVAEADRRRSRAQGQLDAAVAQLKELGAKSVKDALQMKERLDAEIEKLERNFADTVAQLDETWSRHEV